MKLSSEDVACYTLDENGDIDRLILNSVTGDTASYVYITSAVKNDQELNVSSSYTYYQNGTQSTYNSSNSIYGVTTGGAAMLYEDGELKNMRQLKSVELTQLGDLYAMAGNRKYALDESVQVLLKSTGSTTSYYATTLSEIDTQSYRLTGWYDDLGYSAGGRIRIIIAVPE